MGKPEFNQDAVKSFLQSRKIATLEEPASLNHIYATRVSRQLAATRHIHID